MGTADADHFKLGHFRCPECFKITGWAEGPGALGMGLFISGRRTGRILVNRRPRMDTNSVANHSR